MENAHRELSLNCLQNKLIRRTLLPDIIQKLSSRIVFELAKEKLPTEEEIEVLFWL
jgi:hypothetical protein